MAFLSIDSISAALLLVLYRKYYLISDMTGRYIDVSENIDVIQSLRIDVSVSSSKETSNILMYGKVYLVS